MWHTVENSSNIAGFGYEADKEELVIAFHPNRRYRYRGVPKAAFDALQQAESKGKYVAAFIRNAYPYERIPGEFGKQMKKYQFVLYPLLD